MGLYQTDFTMNKLLAVLLFFLLAASVPSAEKQLASADAQKSTNLPGIKVPVYAWMGGPGRATKRSERSSRT
jgi:hypothetical protein